jgi:two-component system, OmpR family, response regulator RegX3
MQGTGPTDRILVVASDESFARQLVHALRMAGFATTLVPTAADATTLCGRWRFDLVVLDAALPDANAHDLCEQLHRTAAVPVVMLAPSLQEADRDAWLDGAEDYLVKPARMADAVARIRAVLRRTRDAIALGVVSVGPLRIDTELTRAELGGVDLRLSPKELQLLARLARDAGTAVTREQLLRDVWGPDWSGSARTLDVHVGLLRRKLGEDPAHQLFIQTVRGVGFRLATAQELGAAQRRPETSAAKG